LDQFIRTENTEQQFSINNNNEDSLQASKVSKKHNQASKLQNIGTRIPSLTKKKFLKFVLDKHGKINGVFAQEITKALEFWMDNQQQTTSFTFSSSNSRRPRADKTEKLRQISMKLNQLTTYPYVNPFTIVHIIKDVLGSCDKCTLNSYLKIIKNNSKENTTTSGTGSEFDVTTFVEKIQGDKW